MVKEKIPRLLKILAGIQTGAESEFNRLERFAHFCVLIAKNFARNRCPARASALSYATLLAMIPLLAVAISVTSSLLKSEGEEKIYQTVDKIVSNIIPPAMLDTNWGVASNSAAETNSISASANDSDNDLRLTAQKEVAKDIHEFIQNTQNGALGVIGMLLLVYVAIRMLANIEATFNDIWGVTRGRSWLLRVVLYWTAITLGPLLIIFAFSLTSENHFQNAKNFVGQVPFVGSLFFEFLPLVVLCLTFALIYRLVPNTKVNSSAALVGGFIGGSLWHLNNLFGFLYVSRVVTNSKIYGKLGLVPVFMIGLYFSWLILLFGAQVAYAFQNRKSYLQDKIAENVNQRGREFIALRLMTFISQCFQRGAPATLQEISVKLEIPTKLAQQILQPLIAARLVAETAGAEQGYLPARPLETINAHHVLCALRNGGKETALRDGSERAGIFGEFTRIEEAERSAASAVTMLALANREKSNLQIEDHPREKEL